VTLVAKEEGEEEEKKEKKAKGWLWKEPNSNHHCWELKLSSKPPRLMHEQRLARFEGGPK
jgi:hypothetical protein